MTAFAPGGRLWTRRSGYSSYSLFLRLRGPAVGTVGHASPSVHSGPASSSASLHDHTAITAHHDPTSAIVLAGIVDSTHLSRSRECSASSKYLRFVHRPSRLILLLLLLGHRLLSRIFFLVFLFFFFASPLSSFIVESNDLDDSLR